ncbi:OLC1v1031720C1 [Oldenlandia corymbosa var. corymbosa]|uniref:OLC1v1031720C1 n=1 Tax=Oldenlandia corymbosa var. corymbosa TaxID=529605 RepID=A0AAV1CM30_OLDCO|nr:OLC1v1031720C1 [Oldenlandia corymbosa var. corymbosa]
MFKKMVRNRMENEEIKKGPWTAEEDEILMNFIKENGPKDWSTIRSKGLLPRTGKSCRLRWVNKLQPNLKKGCKFSAEEERLVLELQATIGNKWAAISTYLPGRTDNDVKNFWSTRQKRLARILRTSSQPNRNLKRRGKAPVVDEASPSLQDSKVSTNQPGESALLNCKLCSCLCSESFPSVNFMSPPSNWFPPFLVDYNMNLPPMMDVKTNVAQPPTSFHPNDDHHISFTNNQLLTSTVVNDLLLVQENHDNFGEQKFMEGFAYHQEEAFEVGTMAQELNSGLSLELLEANDQNYGDNNVADDYKDSSNMIPMPADLFDDFSDDMLDNIDKAPPSSSSS